MTLLELMKLLRKKLWLVIALPVIFAVVAAAVCWGVLPNQYSSDVSLYILSKSGTGTSVSATSSDMTASQQLANDVAVIAKTDRVSEATQEALGLSSLKDYKVSVSSSTTNRVVTLTVSGTDAPSVAKVANEMANQVSQVAVEAMDLQAVNILDSARVADSPSGPNRLMYTLVAFLAGLFVAIAIIVLLDMLDTSVRSDDELEELLGIPVIGRMPNLKEVK